MRLEKLPGLVRGQDVPHGRVTPSKTKAAVFLPAKRLTYKLPLRVSIRADRPMNEWMTAILPGAFGRAPDGSLRELFPERAHEGDVLR